MCCTCAVLTHSSCCKSFRFCTTTAGLGHHGRDTRSLRPHFSLDIHHHARLHLLNVECHLHKQDLLYSRKQNMAAHAGVLKTQTSLLPSIGWPIVFICYYTTSNKHIQNTYNIDRHGSIHRESQYGISFWASHPDGTLRIPLRLTMTEGCPRHTTRNQRRQGPAGHSRPSTPDGQVD